MLRVLTVWACVNPDISYRQVPLLLPLFLFSLCHPSSLPPSPLSLACGGARARQGRGRGDKGREGARAFINRHGPPVRRQRPRRGEAPPRAQFGVARAAERAATP